jgi:Terminase small subunit
MAERERFRGGSAHAAGPSSVEEVAERAARLGITVERVLEEYARIGFANVRDIVDWDDDGIKVKRSRDLTEAQVSAIAEVVATAKDRKIYRVKMHDKTPVLGALGRAIGVFPQKKIGANEDEQADDDAGEAQEFLIQELDRLAAEVARDEGDPEAPGQAGGK